MIAAQFAFAGRAFLDTDARRLRSALDEVSGVEGLRAALDAGEEALEVEYVRLFLNPAGAPCSPWQSAHEEEGRLMGAAHSSARLWYSRYGAAPKADSEPADHAGLLLMFYAQMIASGAPVEEQENFAALHLAWIPALAEKVSRESRLEFYRELGAWTAKLVRSVLR